MSTKRLLRLFTLLSVLVSNVALAQTPQLDLLIDGNLIIGIVNNSSGGAAANAAVTVQEQTQTSANANLISMTTDTAGVFTVTAEYATEYRLTVNVDGQSVSGTIRTGDAPEEPFQWPPIYITLAVLGLLSLIPAHFLRREDITA